MAAVNSLSCASDTIFWPNRITPPTGYFRSKSGNILIYSQGIACDYSEEEATKILSDEEVTIYVDMHMGREEATAWGCDLSYDYVKINADYRS